MSRQYSSEVTHEVVSEQNKVLGHVVVRFEVKPEEAEVDFELQWRPRGGHTIQWNWKSFTSQYPDGSGLATAFRRGYRELEDLPDIFNEEDGELEKVEEMIAKIK